MRGQLLIAPRTAAVTAVLLLAAAGSAVADEPAALDRIAALSATLVVIDVESGEVLARIHPDRAARRAAPCSTFKVPNALIALATGAVREGDDVIRRDPETTPAEEGWPESWKRSEHRLASAIRDSVVWYFQEVARRVGEEEYRRWLARLEYGNGQVHGGVDRFWLAEPLAVSADEQAAFLRRLLRGELPFAERHVTLVADAMELETSDGWTWYGKTGTCRLDADGEASFDGDGGFLGWLVGWVDGPRGRHVYAFNVDMESFRELWRLRPALVQGALAELGLFDSVADAGEGR